MEISGCCFWLLGFNCHVIMGLLYTYYTLLHLLTATVRRKRIKNEKKKARKMDKNKYI